MASEVLPGLRHGMPEKDGVINREWHLLASKACAADERTP